MGVFITNEGVKNFKERLKVLIKNSEELKFLVGFFYFSGMRELYETLKEMYKKNELQTGHIKVLVGLYVDVDNYGIYEIARKRAYFKEYSIDAIKKTFFESVKRAFNSDEMDNKDFYEQVDFFIKLLEEEKLILRKTIEPNHAKLYLFKLKDNEILPNLFIIGSSNLTKAGLTSQNEFNVEIKDFGFKEAEEYFDGHWNKAVELSKNDISKLVNILRNETLLRKVNPFTAYVYLLKTYLEIHQGKDLKEDPKELMEKAGYKPYSYQLTAVSQAKSNCEAHNGTILADVVGLGKTVIACLTAKVLGKRGIVICPPHLIGDDAKLSGWKKYLEDFKLYDWEVFSVGKLEEALNFVKKRENIEIVIVDEAHRFRNERTQSYYYLSEICRGRKVILLTATPFNNRPADLFALLKLFTIPKKSSIVLDEDLESRFWEYEHIFKKLSYIKNYHNSYDIKKRKQVEKYYKEIFRSKKVDLGKVNEKAKEIANEIRSILEPVVIRRNRLDLRHFKEKIDLPEVKDPIEWFYELTPEQLEFYDEVIQTFAPFDGSSRTFSGAIYFPIKYEKGIEDYIEEISFYLEGPKYITPEESFLYFSQRNLYDFMRRLLVKRFESSFGAFYESLQRFKRTHEKALKFIERTGKFILDRKLLEKIAEADDETIEAELAEYEKSLEEEKINRKYYKIYEVNNFKQKNEFITHIKNDIRLFEHLMKRLEEVGLREYDPKVERLTSGLKEYLAQGRKVVIFTEYIDTAKHLAEYLRREFEDSLLVAIGNLSKSTLEDLYKNFDAQYKEQDDRYKILLTTDKLSEGINLNRAGVVINYDIPWNPVRVIQRVGRINRIGKKVYDEIYIVNFFPTEKGADIVKSREIAQTKMFMIHNILGEDAKIFAPDEEPQPAELYRRLTTYKEDEEESFYSKIKSEYENITKKYPEIEKEISNLPKRIKVAKRGESYELLVFVKKGKDLFVSYKDYRKAIPEAVSFEKVIEKVRCEKDEPALSLSSDFWDHYDQILNERIAYQKSRQLKPNELSNKAFNLLNTLLKLEAEQIKPLIPFIHSLIEDIRKYGTLSDYVWAEIVSLETFLKKGEIDKIADALKKLKEEIGEDFLEKIKERLKSLDREIIIAIENQAIL
ncbi:helicase domain-containing protein [Thermodesulfobacterium geofontis OPF15]|uniref:Helicase domain-containing protein n=1 Tax=Thermodesulfobacterium geofontis (strain OPF15) TaxID=795359 RepID=F8C5Z8_THEGP|nr:helicase-related protein [Thermodesulfobacterium geofontis]AEH23141.1 helicase domain-containing protein [Thermodesulfobacterium geofontis OPF15]